MSLSAWEQQTLDLIGDVLAGSDPELAVLLTTFSELASGQEMPAAEQIRPWPHLTAWLASSRRHRPRRRGIHRRGHRLVPMLTARWTVPLLWLLIIAALISTVLALSGGASQGPCPRSWPAACASTVPVHPSAAVTPSTNAGIPASAPPR